MLTPLNTYGKREEQLNVASHAIALLLAALGLLLLLQKADDLLALSAVSIYGGSLMLLFLASSLYHASRQLRRRAVLKLCDHSAIYLLIAGTYTPILLLKFDGVMSWGSMLVIWSLALFGVVFKCCSKHRFPRISLSTYLLMGWLCVLLAYPMYLNIMLPGLVLLAAGGLLFSLGALFYVAKHRAYSHAIWHLFVAAGCACHFIAIYGYIL